MNVDGPVTLIIGGAPEESCKARAPIKRAISYLVESMNIHREEDYDYKTI